ncbi:MAG: hypothetical protein ACK5P7_07035 [Bdellovibrio sp.]|jgi:F-type H+-transporting ATPase subunit b
MSSWMNSCIKLWIKLLSQCWPAACLILAPSIVLAAGSGGGHGLDEKTTKTIIFQAINVGIMLAAMVYFLKNTVQSYFKEKRAAFLATAEKAQAAKRQAQREHDEIKNQLIKLESTADDAISRAKAEAVDMRKLMIQEAQGQVKKIQEEASRSAQIEIQRARRELRDHTIREATRLAKETIEQKVSIEDHKRLQVDFIQNIGTVQQ